MLASSFQVAWIKSWAHDLALFHLFLWGCYSHAVRLDLALAERCILSLIRRPWGLIYTCWLLNFRPGWRFSECEFQTWLLRLGSAFLDPTQDDFEQRLLYSSSLDETDAIAVERRETPNVPIDLQPSPSSWIFG